MRKSLAWGANVNARYTLGTEARRAGPDYYLPHALIGATPYVLAAKFASTDMMRDLAAAGADLRLAAANGTTALMAAASNDHPAARLSLRQRPRPRPSNRKARPVKVALELGADVNAADAEGDAALRVPTVAQFNSIIQLLVANAPRLE